MLILFSLISCLMIFSVVPASADNNNMRTNYRANATTVDDNDFGWGWLGLIGLAGLFGMRSRERDRDRA